MNIHRNGENFKKWCKQSNADPHGMDMDLSEALFAHLLKCSTTADSTDELERIKTKEAKPADIAPVEASKEASTKPTKK